MLYLFLTLFAKPKVLRKPRVICLSCSTCNCIWFLCSSLLRSSDTMATTESSTPSSWGWVQTSVESPWKLGGLIYHYTSLYHIYPKNTPNLKFARSLKDVKWPRNCEISYRMHLLWWLQTPGSSFNVDSLTGVPKCPIVQFGRALQTACQTATFRWSKNPKNVKWETFITPLPNWSIWCLKMLATPWYCHNLVGKMMLKTKK